MLRSHEKGRAQALDVMEEEQALSMVTEAEWQCLLDATNPYSFTGGLSPPSQMTKQLFCPLVLFLVQAPALLKNTKGIMDYANSDKAAQLLLKK